MLNLDLIRNDPDGIRQRLLTRVDAVDLDSILELDTRRRAAQTELDERRTQHKATSKEIGALRRTGVDTQAQTEQASAMADEISRQAATLAEVEQELHDLLMALPNLPHPDLPVGGKEANQVVTTWGERPELAPDAPDHVELCTRLRLVDYDRGVKLGGRGSWIYTGLGAALEWALLDFFCREHLAAGYTFLLPPHLLTEESGYASGQFPKFHDEVFHIRSGDDEQRKFLLPTAETAILNMYRDEILPAADLPVRAFAYTPCYRHEFGSYRSEERGTIRGQQFNKVEMFQFVEPDQSDAAMDELVARSEMLLQKLGLHYQTSLLATRDASASMARTIDVEVWLPSLGIYKEVSSVSNAGDYQARRANIRYREPGQKPTFVHTLNGSGLATSRLLPAIVEQNQQPDGSILVPEPLQPWLGRDVIRPD